MASLLLAARFAAFPALQFFALWSMLTGGWWTWAPGLLLVGALAGIDGWSGGFRRQIDSAHPVLFEAVIWASVLLTVALSLGLLSFTAGDGTPFAALGNELRGPDHPMSVLGAVASTGVILGIGTAASHELFHRPFPVPWYAGQAALAQFFYAPMAVEHVFGHHRDVGLRHDVTTAPRGMGFWRYLVRAVGGTYANALRLEARRLARRNGAARWLGNRALQGLALQAGWAGLLLWGGGVAGLAGALVAGFLAILAVETSQYVSHYGIVRVPGRPVEDRHAWNNTYTLSTSLMFNLQRHSCHHRNATRPFWALSVPDDAPVYPLGMGAMGLLALIPPVFLRVTGPLLDDWRDRLASAEERALIAARDDTAER